MNDVRQLSPEIPFHIESSNSNVNDENKDPNDDNISPTTILLANGQPLLTNFEEKYLIDLILKTSNDDIEKFLQEKVHFILQMNYGLDSSLFKRNTCWFYDFLLKNFQTLIEHNNSNEIFERIFKKKPHKNNSTSSHKYWQLQTLFNEHRKQYQSLSNSHKRRMTVRRLNLN